MNYYPFQALLRSNYNDINEYGQARLVADDNAVDFTGEFVPLLPLSTDASIEWVLGNKTIAVFNGSVYLSSQKLLRLVDVDSKALNAVRPVFSSNTFLPGEVSVGSPSTGKAKSRAIPVNIIYLSYQEVKLNTAHYIGEGETIYLSAEVNFLTLTDLVLRVRKRVLIKRDEALLLCTLESGGNDNFVALSTYLARLEKQAKKEL